MTLPFLLLVFYVAPIIAAPQCGSDKVFSMRIKDVPLLNDTHIRGIPIDIGTPPQTLAFLPTWPINGTWVYDRKDAGGCDMRNYPDFCKVHHGNLLDTKKSKTFELSKVNLTTDAKSFIKDRTQWVQDTLSLTSNVSLPDYKFGILSYSPVEDYNALHKLGMGPSSSLLSSLLAAGKILSRSWSFFWGMATSQAGVRYGSFTLGGYDRGLATGKKHTSKLDPPTNPCDTGLNVNVTSLEIKLKNGTRVSLMPEGDAGYPACIVPDWPMVIDMPSDPYYEAFERLTRTKSIGRSTGIDADGMVYKANDVFDGDLAIGLSNGLSASIANSQLVVYDRYNDESGGIQIDTTQYEVLINSLKEFSPWILPRIGRAFFSAAYLMVDHDAEEFSMWEIPADQQTAALTEQELVPICTKKDERLAIDPASSNADADDGDVQETAKKPLTHGAIAGIAIGSLAGAALLGALLVLLTRRLIARHDTIRPGVGNELDSRPTVLPKSPQEIWGKEKPTVRHEMPHGMGSPRCLGIDMGNGAVDGGNGRYSHQRNAVVYEMPASPYKCYLRPSPSSSLSSSSAWMTAPRPSTAGIHGPSPAPTRHANS